MKNTIEKGDLISLVDLKNNAYLIDTNDPTDHYKGVGILNPYDLVGKKFGTTIDVNTKKFYIFNATLPDKLKSLKRKAQIILPKDAAHIVIHCDITPGKIVLESGIGSASLTTVLASLVKPDGKVISYEKRDDFIKHAEKNLKKEKLLDYVEIKEKDITEGISEKNLDSVILDIPNPYDAIDHAWKALKPGGMLCTYSPLISQVEQSTKKMLDLPFIDLKTLETLQRDIIVKEQGTRPSFSMLGHTGYLTFARKILKN